MSAVSFALLSLLFSGCVDVTFKLYSRRSRSRGMFVCGMGVVWLTLQIGLFMFTDRMPDFNTATLLWGLVAGTALTASNILLVECLTHLDVSLGSLVYRLNTIGVVVLSYLFLGEEAGAVKLAGIGLGVVAVLLLYQPRALSAASIPLAFFAVAVIASCFRALYGVFSKVGLEAGADLNSMLLIIPLCWIIGGLLYAALREKRVRMTMEKAKFCAVGGILAYLIVFTLMSAISMGDVSTLIPIANLGFVIALAISIGARMETFTIRKGLAMGLAAGSIFLLSQV
jgi:drug/metabolite transporter (DMT)-like permease